MSGLQIRDMSRGTMGILLLLAARGVTAHDHDTSEIEDGEYMSPEPLVRWLLFRIQRSPLDTDFSTGFDTMDTYSPDDLGFWHHIPNGNGSRCK